MLYRYFLIFLWALLLIGCGSGSGGSSLASNTTAVENERYVNEEPKGVKIEFRYIFSSIFAWERNYDLPPEPPKFSETVGLDKFQGELQVIDLIENSTKTYSWSLNVDQKSFYSQSSEQLSLEKGEYKIALLVSYLGTQYYGTDKVKIEDSTPQEIFFHLHPVIKDPLESISEATTLTQTSFEFFTTDLFYKSDSLLLKSEEEQNIYYNINKNSETLQIYVNSDTNDFNSLALVSGEESFFEVSLINEEQKILVK